MRASRFFLIFFNCTLFSALLSAQTLPIKEITSKEITFLRDKYAPGIKDLKQLGNWANELLRTDKSRLREYSEKIHFLAQQNLDIHQDGSKLAIRLTIMLTPFFSLKGISVADLGRKNIEYTASKLNEAGKLLNVKFELVAFHRNVKTGVSELIFDNSTHETELDENTFQIVALTEMDKFWKNFPGGPRTVSDFVGNRIPNPMGESLSAIVSGADYAEPEVFLHEFTHWALLNVDAYQDESVNNPGYPELKTFNAFQGRKAKGIHPLEIAISLVRFGFGSHFGIH